MNWMKQHESCSGLKTKWCTVRFDCIIPERLRLLDECDWSVAPDSLLPFEYGPSSNETAERYKGAVLQPS